MAGRRGDRRHGDRRDAALGGAGAGRLAALAGWCAGARPGCRGADPAPAARADGQPGRCGAGLQRRDHAGPVPQPAGGARAGRRIRRRGARCDRDDRAGRRGDRGAAALARLVRHRRRGVRRRSVGDLAGLSVRQPPSGSGHLAARGRGDQCDRDGRRGRAHLCGERAAAARPDLLDPRQLRRHQLGAARRGGAADAAAAAVAAGACGRLECLVAGRARGKPAGFRATPPAAPAGRAGGAGHGRGGGDVRRDRLRRPAGAACAAAGVGAGSSPAAAGVCAGRRQPDDRRRCGSARGGGAGGAAGGRITALLGGPFFLWLLSRLRVGGTA